MILPRFTTRSSTTPFSCGRTHPMPQRRVRQAPGSRSDLCAFLREPTLISLASAHPYAAMRRLRGDLAVMHKRSRSLIPRTSARTSRKAHPEKSRIPQISDITRSSGTTRCLLNTRGNRSLSAWRQRRQGEKLPILEKILGVLYPGAESSADLSDLGPDA